MANDDVVSVVNKLGVESRFHRVLGDLCGGEANYLPDIVAKDIDGSTDADGKNITKPVARRLVRKLQRLRPAPEQVQQPQQQDAPPEQVEEPLPALPDDPRDIHALRKAVAAIDAPDEGMRATRADVLKMQAAADPAVAQAIGIALRGSAADAAAGAAVIRSISITPVAATSVVSEESIPKGLAGALSRPRLTAGPVLLWALPAVARLAQHRETHSRLFAAGLPRLLEAHAHNHPNRSVEEAAEKQQRPLQRLDLFAAVALAFLSESGGADLASRVPLRAVPELVSVLHGRLFMSDPDQIVSSLNSLGLPLYSRPRFWLQALHRLVALSGEHREAAWRTLLPELLAAVLKDDVPNDANENKPFGSPDALELATELAEVMLASSDAGDPQARSTLEKAFKKVAGKKPASTKPFAGTFPQHSMM